MMQSSSASDILVVGGGIVGLATANYLLAQEPALKLTVLEKEPGVARHQSGRNSGVIHSGIYYRPGSAKAQLCTLGRARLLEFCESEALPFDICGKVIVATTEPEVERLAELARRGTANGVEHETLNHTELGELEPHVRGLSALHVPAAGIVDFRDVANKLAERVLRAPHSSIEFGATVHAIENQQGQVGVQTSIGYFKSRFLINCAGLHADRIARLAGQTLRAQIVPFRGDYFVLKGGHELVRNLIYPVPDPNFPFLGVHATRTMAGEIECGPNASLALGREAYAKYSVDPNDLRDALTYPGVWRLLRKHTQPALRELHQSLSKRAFLTALRKLLPEAEVGQLVPRQAGIRAQALAPDGSLIDDFWFEESEHVLSVCSAPSPAATACLAIGENIGRRVLERLGAEPKTASRSAQTLVI